MRAPPQKKFFWIKKLSLVALVCCVAAAIGTALFGSHKNSAIAPAAASYQPSAVPVEQATTIAVVFLKKSLNTGDSFEDGAAETENRPPQFVPDNAVVSPEELRGKVALGPIPAHAVIAREMLGNSVAILPATLHPGNGAVIDDLLAALSKRLAEVEITFAGAAPVRGARVSLQYSQGNGSPVQLTDEAWVSGSHDSQAKLLLSPEAASQLRTLHDVTYHFTALPRA